MELTIDEFAVTAELIYTRTGIRFEEKKNYFLSKRIMQRKEELKIQSFSEYMRLLKYGDENQSEFQKLINLCTTNETYFFRDFPQLTSFGEYCLKEVCTRKVEEGKNTLRIWSAGCSTGEEPYTLAIILSEILQNTDNWSIQIIASDVDLNVLAKAKKGVYSNSRMNEVPAEYLEKYFIAKGDNLIVTPKIKSMVSFEHLNFSDKDKMRNKRGFDFIFCRNVLIYFDDVSRKKVVDHFYLSLESGGYIFLGSSESLSRITASFTLKKVGSHLLYHKEAK
jgi:chemotaxis protein methyltransferase CheR